MTENYTPVDIYQKLHRDYPGTPEGVGWHNYERQITRFGALVSPVDLKKIHTILDAGCGYGDLYDYLQNWRLLDKEAGPFTYTGADVHDAALDWARERFKNYDDRPGFLQVDVRGLAQLHLKFDLVVASGILAFYSPMDQLQIVNRLWQMTEKVLSFNFKATSSVAHDFDTLRTWIGFTGSKKWEISHSYLEDDYTVTIWREEHG